MSLRDERSRSLGFTALARWCTSGIHTRYTLLRSRLNAIVLDALEASDRMPLPRFHRLPAEQRAHIVATARSHIAEHGHEASYNQIIADAGISKASAYHYFDGKADLFAEVRRALDAELAALIGPWKRARTTAALWKQLRTESARLRAHFAAHEGDLRVLAVTQGESDGALFDPWFDALIDNGVELGLVRTDIDRSLVRDATRALFAVFDARAIAAMREKPSARRARSSADSHGDDPDADADEQSWELLRALWAPNAAARGAT